MLCFQCTEVQIKPLQLHWYMIHQSMIAVRIIHKQMRFYWAEMRRGKKTEWTIHCWQRRCPLEKVLLWTLLCRLLVLALVFLSQLMPCDIFCPFWRWCTSWLRAKFLNSRKKTHLPKHSFSHFILLWLVFRSLTELQALFRTSAAAWVRGSDFCCIWHWMVTVTSWTVSCWPNVQLALMGVDPRPLQGSP